MMRKVHKKVKDHLSKMSGFYAKGLGGPLAIFVIFAGIFWVTQARDPYISELAFIERSTGNIIGSVIPASCYSTPPINHSGDCPPAVEVNIGTGNNNLTASITNVTSNEQLWFSSPNTWIVGNGGQYYDTPYITISVNYTSGGGSTKCRIMRNQTLGGTIRPASGSVMINVYPHHVDDPPSSDTYSFVCSDGIYFISTNSVNVIGNFTNYNSNP